MTLPPERDSEGRGLLYVLLSAFAFSSGWLISKVRTPVEQPIDSEPTQNNSEGERSGRQSISNHPIRVVVESLPPPEPPKHERQAEKKKDRRPQWGILVVNFLTLTAVIVYACITYGQWRAMLDSNKINRDSFQTVQRAFVFVRVIEAQRIGDEANFMITWENSGTTPTKDLHVHVSYMPLTTPLPDNFPFPDLWTPGTPHVTVNAVIGPKATTGITVGPVPISTVSQIFEHKKHLYLWGWAEYHDVFDGTPMHITRFCVEVVVVSRTPIPGQPNQFQFLLRPDTWPKNNCYDKECEKQ
jgi:hypothetical protein